MNINPSNHLIPLSIQLSPETTHPSSEQIESVETMGLTDFAIASVQHSHPSHQISSSLPSSPGMKEQQQKIISYTNSMINKVVLSKTLTAAQRIDQINTELLDINESLFKISSELERSNLSESEVEKLREQDSILTDKYRERFNEKLAIAKAAFSDPTEAILALAVPLTIPANERFCTAGSVNKIVGLLENGIIFDENMPATGSIDGTNFSENELGNRGIYFNRGDEPVYASDAYPMGIKCSTLKFSLLKGVEGCAIIPVSRLVTLGFSKEHIRTAYDTLQKRHAFLQNDGLYPTGTEVVFMRNSDVLRLDSIWSNGNFSLDEAVEYGMIDEDQLQKIRQAWTTQ